MHFLYSQLVSDILLIDSLPHETQPVFLNHWWRDTVTAPSSSPTENHRAGDTKN